MSKKGAFLLIIVAIVALSANWTIWTWLLHDDATAAAVIEESMIPGDADSQVARIRSKQNMTIAVASTIKQESQQKPTMTDEDHGSIGEQHQQQRPVSPNEGIARDRGMLGYLAKPAFDEKPTLLENESSLQRFIVIPEYKLLFCYVEKVGCSMFNALFRLLRLLRPELPHTEAQFQAQRNWFVNTIMHHGLNVSNVETILADPAWTKAVFFRDPASRFLSAFRSKCLRGDNDGMRHCNQSFGNNVTEISVSRPLLAFEMAVHQLQSRVIANEHFLPTYRFCGGLDRSLEYYDSIHHLLPRTAGEHVERLLVGVGVNASLAADLATTIVTSGGIRWHEYSQQIELLHNVTLKDGTRDEHVTGTRHGLTQYYNKPSVLEIVQQYYAKDYELFQLPKLHVDALSSWLNEGTDTQQ